MPVPPNITSKSLWHFTSCLTQNMYKWLLNSITYNINIHTFSGINPASSYCIPNTKQPAKQALCSGPVVSAAAGYLIEQCHAQSGKPEKGGLGIILLSSSLLKFFTLFSNSLSNDYLPRFKHLILNRPRHYLPFIIPQGCCPCLAISIEY